MKFALLSVAALALATFASIASAQQPGLDPIPTPLPPPPVVVTAPPVVVSPPTVIVPRPPVVVVAPAVVPPPVIVRPAVTIGIGGVYPYGFYGRPYYGPYHHRHW